MNNIEQIAALREMQEVLQEAYAEWNDAPAPNATRIARKVHDALSLLPQIIAAVERWMQAAWENTPDEHSSAIDAARAGELDHELYGQAFQMVTNRHGKFALVHLVYWLLKRAAVEEGQVGVDEVVLHNLIIDAYFEADTSMWSENEYADMAIQSLRPYLRTPLPLPPSNRKEPT